MSGFKSDLIRVLVERGFLHQCSDIAALDARSRHARPSGACDVMTPKRKGWLTGTQRRRHR